MLHCKAVESWKEQVLSNHSQNPDPTYHSSFEGSKRALCLSIVVGTTLLHVLVRVEEIKVPVKAYGKLV